MVQKMKHRNGIIILFIIMATFGCKPDPLEYARPDNLAGTIYTQLESMGEFEYYLKALDQTPYKEPLEKKKVDLGQFLRQPMLPLKLTWQKMDSLISKLFRKKKSLTW